MDNNRSLKNCKRPAITLLLITVLMGCSGIGSLLGEKSPDQGAAQPLAACSLLTEVEWETLVGPSPNAPEQMDDEVAYVAPPVQTSLCTYASKQGSVLLVIERPRTTRAADSEALTAELRQDPGLVALGEVEVQPLDGLGLPAAWYDVRESGA